MHVLFKRHSPTALQPKRFSDRAAGFDFHADLGFGEIRFLYPGTPAVIETGISVAVPAGYYMRLAPRSGMALKGIDILGGTIDSDFRGVVNPIFINHGTTKYEIRHGDRVAQGIIVKIGEFEMMEVRDGELPETMRGAGGLGSTGR